MALPVLAKVAGGIAVGYGGFRLWRIVNPKVQSFVHTHPLHLIPVKVVVPVTDKASTPSVADAPIPPNNGTMATYVAPLPVKAGVLATAPFVMSPNGSAANLGVVTVGDVQKALNVLGVAQPLLKEDGISGPLTATAVRKFQVSKGMPADGQITPPLKAELQKALLNFAGTQSHIGESLQVQSASMGLPAPNTPVGGALANTGLGQLAAQAVMHGGFNADVPSNQDAICKLQRLLNVLGATPPLAENGNMTPETVAAVKAFQIAYGLVSDGVPGPKTVTAAVIATDPNLQKAILPSVDKAADHVNSVAAAAPVTTAPVLKQAADALKATAAAPVAHTDAQTNASTAAAQAATASNGAPPGVAEPLAAATAALAAAATTPTPAAPVLAQAASALTAAAQTASVQAASSATSSPAAASIQAAADHITAAAATPDADAQADHLTAAAQHLSNAASGTPAPSVAANPAAPAGDFGWDARTWWQGMRQRMTHLHPAYAPTPRQPPNAAYMNQATPTTSYYHKFSSPFQRMRAHFRGEFGDINSDLRIMPQFGGPGSPPIGHPNASTYWRTRNEMFNRGRDDRHDRRWYEAQGRQGYGWQGQQQYGAPPMGPMPMNMPDPDAINPYEDPNANLDPAADAVPSGG